MQWQVQEAKQRFSELLRRVAQEGPQAVTRHGKEVAYVVDASYYHRLTGVEVEFTDFLLHGPKSEEFAEIMEQIVAERRVEVPSSRDGWVDDLFEPGADVAGSEADAQ
jgi:prevent-host-death family protein